MRRGLAWLALSACGRVAFEPLAQVDAAPQVDAQVSCTDKWLAGDVTLAPQILPSVNTIDSEVEPFITADNATLYFASTRGDGTSYHIYRATVAAAFADATPVPDLDSTSSDGAASLSDDGLFAVVSSDRPGVPFPGINLWQASRATTGETFGDFTAAPFANVNTAASEFDHWMSRDRLRLYVAAADTTQHIALATRATTDVAFSALSVIPELASAGADCCEALSADERVIVFNSTRDGAQLLYYATRASRGDAFSTPHLVPMGGATDGVYLHTSLSGDGCTLYLSATRPGVGSFDLWSSAI